MPVHFCGSWLGPIDECVRRNRSGVFWQCNIVEAVRANGGLALHRSHLRSLDVLWPLSHHDCLCLVGQIEPIIADSWCSSMCCYSEDEVGCVKAVALAIGAWSGFEPARNKYMVSARWRVCGLRGGE